MRQTDFSVGMCVKRRWQRKQLMLTAVVVGANPLLQYRMLRKLRRSTKDLIKVSARSVHISSVLFNLNVYSERAALTDFRFKTNEVPTIASIMNWHEHHTKRSRYLCDSITACCIVLRKLSTPCRWYDLESIFGMHSSKLSEIFWEQMECFVESKGHLITKLRMELLAERAELYARAVKDKGAPLDNCVGFIDCSKIQMCRPGGEGSSQRACYSGHKRIHCLMYQTITTPDGLIFHLHGPEVGRLHDLTLLRNSQIESTLEEHMVVDGKQYCIYGDAAYILHAWLQTAFPRLTANAAQTIYNTKMSAMREAVEWSYKDIKQMWSSQDFKRVLKVRKVPIGLLYTAAALLCNFKVCLGHGGQVATYFNSRAPTLERYLEEQ